jgi:hypothetical protein
MIERKALMEREEKREKEFVIMITKLLIFFNFFLCSYGNDENIHIRTQRETSNMRTHL